MDRVRPLASLKTHFLSLRHNRHFQSDNNRQA
jgi:FG-GAP-like repeat